MKQYLSNIINTVASFMNKYHKLMIVFLFALYGLLLVLFSLPFNSSYLYGVNLSYYASHVNTYVSFESYITRPLILGNLVVSLLINLLGNGNIGYLIVQIILSLSLVISSFFLTYKLSKKYIYAITSSLLLLLSIPVFSSLIYIDSIPSLLSMITLCWLFYVALLYEEKRTNIYFIVMCVLACLYCLNCSFSLLLIPFIGFFALKNRDRKSLVFSGSFLLLVVLSTITSFTQYNRFETDYFAYMVQNLTNIFLVPFGFTGNYLITFSELEYLYIIIILTNGVILFLYLFSGYVLSLISFVRDIKRKNYSVQALGPFICVTLNLILIIALGGFMRHLSLFVLLYPILLLTINSAVSYSRYSKRSYLSLIPVLTSTISVILLCLTVKTAYKEIWLDIQSKNINTLKEDITNGNEVTIVGSSNDIKMWDATIDNYEIDRSKIHLLDISKGENKENPASFYSHKTYYGYQGLTPMPRGINIKNTWISGRTFNTWFYTSDSQVEIELYTHDFYPSNHVKIYFNESLVYEDDELSFFPPKRFSYKLPGDEGGYVHLRIEAATSYAATDFNPTDPDKLKHLAFIVELSAS